MVALENICRWKDFYLRVCLNKLMANASPNTTLGVGDPKRTMRVRKKMLSY